MKSSHLFSFHFNAKRLTQELLDLDQSFHLHHNPGFYDGEWSGLGLRIPENAHFQTDGGHVGISKYQDTALLQSLPYFQEVIDFFKCSKNSIRILKLASGAHIKPHCDEHLNYFSGFVRLHIVIITNDQVEFIANNESLKMLEGQCWYADFSKTHSTTNHGKHDRIHLVMDLEVNDWLEKLFIQEGIMSPEEQAPNPMDEASDDFRIATAKSLLMMGTDTSRQLANELIDKYKLDISR